MTVRSRPSTDEQSTAIYDPDRAQRGAGARAELATPTEISPPPPPLPPPPSSPSLSRPPSAGDARPGMVAGGERSEPLRMISLKAPGEVSEERLPVRQHQPRLRRLSEVAPQRQRVMTPPGGFGYLAPPRDPREARTRRLRDYVLWGSVVVMLAGAVMLAVWFLAGM